MISLAPHAAAIIERARLRSHCQSVENRVLLGMMVDEVNALTRFLDGRFGVYRLSTRNAPFTPYLAKWRKQGIFTGDGRVMEITPLGQAIRRKLFGARMGQAGDWESGCDCKMCESERQPPDMYHNGEGYLMEEKE